MMKNFLILLGCMLASALAVTTALPGPAAYSSASAQAPRVCPKGRIECRAGREGNGGCYELRASFCTDGRVCARGSQVCRRGSLGVGGCYDHTQVTCFDGLRCARGSSVCRPGPKGGGGCYMAKNSVCSEGRISARKPSSR